MPFMNIHMSSSNSRNQQQTDFNPLLSPPDLTDYPILEAFMEVSAEMSEEESTPMTQEFIANTPSMIPMPYISQQHQQNDQPSIHSVPYALNIRRNSYPVGFEHSDVYPPMPHYSMQGKKSHSQSPSQSYSYDISMPVFDHQLSNQNIYNMRVPQMDDQMPDRAPMLVVTNGSKSAPFYDGFHSNEQMRKQHQKQQHEQQWLQYCQKYYHQYMNQYARQQYRRLTRPRNERPLLKTRVEPKHVQPDVNVNAELRHMKNISQLKTVLNDEINKLKILKQKKMPTKNSDFNALKDFQQMIANLTVNKGRNECIEKLYNLEINKYKNSISEAIKHRRLETALNLANETKIIELNDDITQLKEKLEKAKHKNYLSENVSNKEYSENMIIQNLLRTQIEFYFSDYNLKRDKRMLDTLCNKRIGFLEINTIMMLSRIKQLSTYKKQIIQSIKSSKYLVLSKDEKYVGRLDFHRPIEKQYPFRRTVFIFGLPADCNKQYIQAMLDTFGIITKIQFDHGLHSLDRLVAEHMYNEQIKIFKYKYRDINVNIDYSYRRIEEIKGKCNYTCIKCKRVKLFNDGFYEDPKFRYLCLQCTAALAEQIQERCKKGMNERMIEIMCGKAPRNIKNTKTALAVFSSQRQASKCVYVRSRIAYDGCFTTHYHQYSKLKKDIAMTLKPYAYQLKDISPHELYAKLLKQKSERCECSDTISALNSKRIYMHQR